MFISIPKEFFVPVLFSDKFRLNLENNNMEYDTNREELRSYRYRSSDEKPMIGTVNAAGKGPIEGNVQGGLEYLTEQAEEKAKTEKEINLDKETDNSNDNEALSEADEEFIHTKTVEE